ncbi:2,' 3'-cyclic nucleotide 2'-phosphodiesterase [Paenibacillus sp. FSL R10-2748]|uniref:2,' 3'-cyclic nucleotide 2'-phosphodiesterase n=1 Tax=Paenibacillus sp. FSL R10-2748 TaxID=2954658 RepID=UPI0030F831C5
MKKWSYLLSGVLIGAVVATAGSAFADQLKSLVGQTVAGEYAVKVNGNSLSENAIVVDGKAHVPLRAVSDSLGVNLKVDGKTIQITNGSADTKSVNTASTGKYEGWPKEKLNGRKAELEKYLSDTEKDRDKAISDLQKISNMNTAVSDDILAIRSETKKNTEIGIQEAETNIAKYKTELEEINKAIASLK